MQQQNTQKKPSLAVAATSTAAVPSGPQATNSQANQRQNPPQDSLRIAQANGLALLPRSVEDLPPANTRRWVTRRKAQVVVGVKIGLLSVEDACARYDLTEEEFRSWQSLIENHGLRGLRVTRLQQYRRGNAPDQLIGGVTTGR